MKNLPPLTAPEIEARLDHILEVEFSFRNVRIPAAGLAGLPRRDQEYVLDWTGRVASTNLELGYQYACRAVQALALLDRHMTEAWVLHAMDIYDREGLYPAMTAITGLERFLEERHERVAGCLLSDVEGVLTGFVHGLSGRRLKISEGPVAYTDTETIFLPRVIARCTESADNFQLYKLLCATLWAQTRFGTFRVPLAQALADHSDPEALLALFSAFEGLRLEGCLARELPGLHRERLRVRGLDRRSAEEDLAGFQNLSGLEPGDESEWIRLRNELADPAVTAEMVFDLALHRCGELQPYAPLFDQGRLDPQAVAACRSARMEREKIRLRVALSDLARELEPQSREREEGAKRFSGRRTDDADRPEALGYEITLDGRPMPLPEQMSDLIGSILLDLGDIPDDYLEPAGPGEYDAALLKEPGAESEDVWSGQYHEAGAFLYPEWDFRRQAYRKNWCAMREKEVAPIHDGFAERTLQRYSGLVKHLRRTFEAMRDEERRLKRQTDGDVVDLDALVETLADARAGREVSDRLFSRLHRAERNIAVAFMVDMSGSTKGWINDAERESLLLLCEALETLGDRYAIYGFSSITRKRCELYHIKHFDEPYGAEVKGRIGAIRPQDYTRMGFAIRHLSHILNGIDARTRVLITISDGKPDDYDNYRGEYGIEDTRRALIEARRGGVHPYCITIDEQARDYLPHLYGPAAWTLVSEVRSLPLKVSDIYRRLTS